MANRKPPYYISAQQIATMMQIDIRSASDRLTCIRRKLGKPLNALVSIGEYCQYEHTSQKEVEDYFIRTAGIYLPPAEENKSATGNALKKVA
jgi:hypothetical protein